MDRLELWNEWEADLIEYLQKRTDDRAKIDEVLSDVKDALLAYSRPVENHLILFQSAHYKLGGAGDWRSWLPLFRIGA